VQQYHGTVESHLKRHPYTEVKDKRIFTAFRIPIRVEREIQSSRSYWQEVLKPETDPGAEILEIVTEGV
jgi:hypothetical protein